MSKKQAVPCGVADGIRCAEGAMEELYYTKLGGNGGAYPYTVVLDKQGVIRSVFYSSVSYEDLRQAVEKIL